MEKSLADKRTPKPILYIGLDVHKETITEAVAEDGRDGEVRAQGTFSNDLHVLEKRMRAHSAGVSNTQTLRLPGWASAPTTASPAVGSFPPPPAM